METFIILRSKTDDALELFVKAQVLLEFKMKEAEVLKKKQRAYVGVYDQMSMGNIRYLIAKQKEMEDIMARMMTNRDEINALEKELQEMEAECRATEEELRLARAAEREYVATILKNEKTE